MQANAQPGAQKRHIGSSVPRPEDPRLVAGAGRYVADIRVDGCLEAAFARSFEAHAEVRSVDVTEARGVPGVVGVWAAADLPDLPDVPAASPVGGRAGPEEMTRPSLARDRARYVGDPVAVALAADRYVAEDALELVEMDLEPLPVVIDPTAAAADDAVLLFPEAGTNIASEREVGAPIDDALAAADVVVEATVRQERLSPTSMEPRAILVVPENGGLTVWVAHQAPHRLHNGLAEALGLPPERIRVVVPNVGGAFGAKSQTYPEYVTVAHLALKLGRPIRWLEDRQEAFQAHGHGRGQTQRLRLGADADGRIVAVEALVDADVGAYPQSGSFIPNNTGLLLSGAYAIPRLYSRIRTMVGNTAPTVAYRGAGRPEATFAIERLIDRLARRLGMDPVEVRRRNFIQPGAFPYETPSGALYDSGDYEHTMTRALELFGYEQLRAEQAGRRADGGGPLLGIGVCSYVERSGGSAGSNEYGAVEARADGKFVARSGAVSQGQGHSAAFVQVVASALDVDLDRIVLVQGDTAEVPSGTGTFGSRSMQVGGRALQQAAEEVLETARERAADLLEVAAEDLTYAEGRFSVVGTDRGVDVGEIVERTGAVAAEATPAPPLAFPFGTYVAAVEVDPELGTVAIRRFVAVDDCGVVVNPKLVEGQVIGSIAQGLGQALYEEVAYDPDSGQPLVSSLLDYALPTAAEMPELQLGHTVTPNPNLPLGVKGAGETGCIGAPPAVLNAIEDALDPGASPLLEVDVQMPATPERVWNALRTARPSPAG